MSRTTHRAVLVGLAVLLAVYATLALAPRPCHEDMACWDCRTMGNQVCGPTLP